MPAPETSTPSAFEIAYQRLLPAMMAIPEGDLSPITLDVSTVVATAIGAESKLRTFRDDIAKLAPFQDVACIDDLEDAARALMHANLLYQLATEPQSGFNDIAEKAQALRTTLYSDVVALVNRGMLADAELTGYRGTVGYKIVAADLALLAGVLQRAWPKISGNTAIKILDLENANLLSDALITAVGIREQSPARVAEAVRIRARAFALLLSHYDEVRRAIVYLRAKEGDADQLAPSLYANRGNGNHKRRTPDEPAPVIVPPVPPKPAAAPGLPDEDPFSA